MSTRIADWQADDVLPNNIMRWIGGLRTYAQRMQFFFGVPNTLILVGYVFYDRSALIAQVFPNRFVWMGFVLFIVAPAVVGLDRVLLHPAQIFYNQHQNGDEDRSPNYRETMENQRKIQTVEAKVDQLQASLAQTDGGARTVVVPECSACGVRGQPSTHKDSDCIACPECGDILYRGMEVDG